MRSLYFPWVTFSTNNGFCFLLYFAESFLILFIYFIMMSDMHSIFCFICSCLCFLFSIKFLFFSYLYRDLVHLFNHRLLVSKYLLCRNQQCPPNICRLLHCLITYQLLHLTHRSLQCNHLCNSMSIFKTLILQCRPPSSSLCRHSIWLVWEGNCHLPNICFSRVFQLLHNSH